MAANGPHNGGRPNTEADNRRDLAETALFEIGESRSFLADTLHLSRQVTELVKASSAETERARECLDRAMKIQAQALVVEENFKRFASIRMREIVIEEEHLNRLTAAMKIDKIRPALELVRA